MARARATPSETDGGTGHMCTVRLSHVEYHRILRASVNRAKRLGGRVSVGAYMREAALALAFDAYVDLYRQTHGEGESAATAFLDAVQRHRDALAPLRREQREARRKDGAT